MSIEDLQSICKNFKGVTEDIKWDTHLCYNVGGKMFVITSPDEVPVSASFKTSDELFDKFAATPGFSPAPYLGKHKWIHLDDISRVSKKQWKELLGIAYELIYNKLPVKIKNSINQI